jgi:hypothetical protein
MLAALMVVRFWEKPEPQRTQRNTERRNSFFIAAPDLKFYNL